MNVPTVITPGDTQNTVTHKALQSFLADNEGYFSQCGCFMMTYIGPCGREGSVHEDLGCVYAVTITAKYIGISPWQ